MPDSPAQFLRGASVVAVGLRYVEDRCAAVERALYGIVKAREL
jgi:hypothetical protein